MHPCMWPTLSLLGPCGKRLNLSQLDTTLLPKVALIGSIMPYMANKTTCISAHMHMQVDDHLWPVTMLWSSEHYMYTSGHVVCVAMYPIDMVICTCRWTGSTTGCFWLNLLHNCMATWQYQLYCGVYICKYDIQTSWLHSETAACDGILVNQLRGKPI